MDFASPLFGLTLSILAFVIGVKIKNKIKSELFSPLLFSQVSIILLLLVFDISIDDYNEGGDIINLFLTPCASVLALTVYRKWAIIKKNFITITIATTVGVVVHMVTIITLGRLFKLDQVITNSMLGKSITTPLALSLTESLNGITALVVLGTLVAGFIGLCLSTSLIKLFRINLPIAQGVAIGSSSHVLGTTKAVEIGEEQAAISSVSLIFTGVITVLLAMIVF